MSEMPELEVGDLVDKEMRTALTCVVINDNGDAQRIATCGPLTVVATTSHCDYALHDKAHDVVYLTRISWLEKAECLTIHRRGEQIYPKPEPNIEEDIEAFLNMHCINPGGLAALLRTRYTITPKESK